MLLFLDCEFTSLDEASELISAALVPERGGEHLYLESGDFTLSHCSDFVKANVLPHLNDSAQRPTLEAIARRFRKFIVERNEGCLIAADNRWDWHYLLQLLALAGSWPANLDREFLHLRWNVLTPDRQEVAETIRHDYLAARRSHHALDDATANCLAFAVVAGHLPLEESLKLWRQGGREIE